MARTTNVNQRIIFLNSLTKKQDYCPDISIKKEIKELEDWCRKIEDAETYFECSGYEEYGESYWDSDYTYEYSDIFEIGKELSRAFQIAEDLLFQKEYQQAAGLLSEACIYQGGISRLCEAAREVWARHPVLYQHACKYLLNEKKEFECVKLGMEAISVLPEKLIIRGSIADLAAKAAVQLENTDIINQCYEAAFYSESTQI